MPGIADDRTKLLVKVPFGKTLDRMSSLSKQMDSMTARMDRMTVDMDRMTLDIDSLTIFRIRSEDRELILHTANQTVLFINAVAMRTGKKLSSLESHGNSDQHAVPMRLSMAHTLWDEKDWNKDVKLPHKYHDMIKDVSKVLKARNNVAHESTVQFAKLLSEPYFQDSHPGLHQYWTPVFRYIYRK